MFIVLFLYILEYFDYLDLIIVYELYIVLI